MASKKDFAKSGAYAALGVRANAASPVKTVQPTAAAGAVPTVSVDPGSSGLDPAMALAQRIQLNGGVLDMAAMTMEGAKKAGLPLRKHKTSLLIVHPNNARPVSAEDDLDVLIADISKEGQRDPIHILPYNGGWAIVEGQRRWLAHRRLGLEEIDAFEHPEMSPIEVYLYGRATHSTRRDTAAIDDALSMKTLLTQEQITRRELLERLKAMGEKNIEEATLSKQLKITDCHDDLISEIKKAPRKFTHRHLYALAQIQDLAGPNKAIDSARKVVYSEDGKVSAASLERLVASLSESNGARANTRRTSMAKPIMLPGGQDCGVVRAHQGGRIEYSPPKGQALDPEKVQEMHAVVSLAISQFFAGLPND